MEDEVTFVQFNEDREHIARANNLRYALLWRRTIQAYLDSGRVLLPCPLPNITVARLIRKTANAFVAQRPLGDDNLFTDDEELIYAITSVLRTVAQRLIEEQTFSENNEEDEEENT